MTPARTQQSTAKPAGTTRKVSSARRVFALHGWLGLSLGLPLLLICLSGALAVFGHELDWLCNPAMRIRPEGPRLPLDAIYSKVQRAFPEARIVYWQLSMGSCFADELSLSPRVETSGGRETRVFVNPHTGVIQGVSGYLNVRSFLRAFHYYWFDTVTGWGFYLVAAFAFVLLGSVITGMAIYKRWWAGLFTLRLRRGRRLFFSDLHKLCGGWTLAFNFVIALSAIYYLVEWKTDWELVTPRLSAERIAQIPPNATPVPLDEQLENARHHFPSLRVANIAFPETPADPLYFDGQAAAWVVRERANKLLLDPYDGSVVFIQRGENLASG
ncbi:MAG: PepSY-associated TM helix domain-containing protein, partial [Verrucomicrobiota bacterium]